jgi:Glyoxalase-like domain
LLFALIKTMELDHVFILIEPLGPEIDYLRSLGITQTYRRRHSGQGTQNICYCFDNLFLELLWIDDANSVRSEPIARTGIYERAQWQTAGTNPFGIAWRDTSNAAPFTPSSWAFKPPYLPTGMHIDVAVDGDDHHQPMMFKSPGATPPSEWPVEKRGALQKPAGLGRVITVQLNTPQTFVPSDTLKAIEAASILQLGISQVESFGLTLTVERLDLTGPLVLQLPVKNSSP